MEKLTDEQLKTLGTAIGAEIVRKFDAKQSYWYNSDGWLSKVAQVLGKEIAEQLTCDLKVNPEAYTRITDKFAEQLIKNVGYYRDIFINIGSRIFGEKTND